MITEAALREREDDLARVRAAHRRGRRNCCIDVAGDMRGWRSPEYHQLHGLPDDVREEMSCSVALTRPPR